MNKDPKGNDTHLYTNDHEWIDFQGNVALIGICSFKLSGFKTIDQFSVHTMSGVKKKGEVIATVKYNDYQIEAHMPVDGKIVQVNDALLKGDAEVLLQQPENDGWIALITPADPRERKDLLLHEHYQQKVSRRYAK